MCFKPMMDLAFPVFFSCNTKWIEKMFWTFWMTKNHRVVYLVDLNVFELSMFTGAVRSTSFQSQRSKLRGSRSMPPFQNELRCWRTGCITPWHRGLKIGIHFFLFFFRRSWSVWNIHLFSVKWMSWQSKSWGADKTQDTVPQRVIRISRIWYSMTQVWNWSGWKLKPMILCDRSLGIMNYYSIHLPSAKMCQTCWENSIKSFSSLALGWFQPTPFLFANSESGMEPYSNSQSSRTFEISPLLRVLTYIWLQQSQHPLVVSVHGSSISSPHPLGRCWDPGPSLCRGWNVVRIMTYEVWNVIFVHGVYIYIYVWLYMYMYILVLLRMYCILNEY